MYQLLGALLLSLVQPILSRIITAFGFGLVSYSGLNLMLGQLENWMIGQTHSMSSDMFIIIGMSGFGQAITTIMSALLVRAYLNGMNSVGSIVQTKFGSK